MITEKIFIIIMLIFLVIWILLAFIILPNNYLYNAVFNRKQRKLQKFLIRNADKFNYIGAHEIGKAFRWGDYLAVIWFDDTCSIHIGTSIRHECLATDFDKVMSNRMRDLLLTKIK